MKATKKKINSKTSNGKTKIEIPAAPLHELPTECHDSYLLEDDEGWLIFIEPALCDNPAAAESFAHLLCTLKQAIESGPEGAKRARFTIIDGMRIAYRYTEAHQLAFELFMLYLEDRLKPEDEPVRLLKAAIERAAPKKAGSGDKT